MKKRLLTLGALALAFSASAQFVSSVANNSVVNIEAGALVYQGGGVKTIGTGKIDNSGNIMVVGNTVSKFITVATDNATPKTDGGNIIMRMTNETIGSFRYGQLYIKGLSQGNITGIVDKEYKDIAHGTYQQVALPFFDKELSTLSVELGKPFSNSRWTQNEILVANNAEVRSDLLNLSTKTSKGVAYYMLGSKGFVASADKKVVKGIPYADGITENLLGAGAGIDFGADGAKINSYREKYNTYVQDAWDYSNGAGAWKDNYGRNIYQFGNPYLTNLDLGQLGKSITNLQGVRIEPQEVTTTKDGATYSKTSKYVNYTSSGIAVGDNNAIIRPMQTFVIKLKNNDGATLNFDDLRRFKYVPRAESESYKVNALSVSNEGGQDLVTMSSRSSRLELSSSTVKQLGVIALNSKGEEIGRTYYVVYADGVSGKPNTITTQTTASGSNIIGTFEESKEGGLDEEFKNAYWLYINEANENDFKGKEVPLRLYSEDIKALKFEIKENASEIKDGQEKLSSGESFYINLGDNIVAVNNGKSIPLSSTTAEFGLYYGKPSTLSVNNDIVAVDVVKPSETFIAFDTNDSEYKLIFDKAWKIANVQVYDISGRLILSQNNVNTSNNFVINLPSGKGVYIVTAISETGHKFSQKVVK